MKRGSRHGLTASSLSLRRLVADNIKRRRLAKGLSQEELAELCGYHRTYIGAVERAERNITLSTLEAIAQALSINPIDLFKDE